MKQILLLSALLIAASAFSQTRLIAHKSHSGNSLSYLSFDVSGNFGDPGPRLKIVEKLNDTMVLMTHEEWFDPQITWTDTFYNHPLFSNPNMPVDSIRKSYYMHDVEFKNFDRPAQQETPKAEPVKQPNIGAKSDKYLRHDVPAGKRDGRPKQNTLWLVLIGAGTFLAAGLTPFLFRSRSLPDRRA